MPLFFFTTTHVNLRMDENLIKVQSALNNFVTESNDSFRVTEVNATDISMLSIVHSVIDEFAIIATASKDQLLFNVTLFDESQVAEGKIDSLHKMMLELNIAMPLSSFALTNGNYSIFGAMSVDSSASEIQEEVLALSENIMDALEVCQNFFKMD